MKIKFDPYQVAQARAEHEMHRFIGALLEHFGVSQVELDLYKLVNADHAIEITDTVDGKRHYRIIGKMELVDAPTP